MNPLAIAILLAASVTTRNTYHASENRNAIDEVTLQYQIDNHNKIRNLISKMSWKKIESAAIQAETVVKGYTDKAVNAWNEHGEPGVLKALALANAQKPAFQQAWKQALDNIQTGKDVGLQQIEQMQKTLWSLKPELILLGEAIGDQATNTFRKASKYAAEHPKTTFLLIAIGAGGILIYAVPGLVSTPLLYVSGFVPSVGKTTLAAGVQSSSGNVATGSWFATMQSAGAGGSGIIALNSAIQSGAAMVAAFGIGALAVKELEQLMTEMTGQKGHTLQIPSKI